MAVITAKAWDRFRDLNLDEAFGRVAGWVLLKYLEDYVPADFRDSRWRIGLTEADAKRKAKAGKPGVDDLIFTGALYTELATNAPKAVKVEKGVAFVILDQSKVPYMAAHQYGYSPNKLPSRRYIRLVEHEADLTRDLSKKFFKLMIGETV